MKPIERKKLLEKYKKIRLAVKSLPDLDKIENILGIKFLSYENFENEFKRSLWRSLNNVTIELSKIIYPDSPLSEVRSNSIKGEVKDKIVSFLRDLMLNYHKIIEKDIEGDFLSTISLLWEYFSKGLNIYLEALNSIDPKELEVSLSSPDEIFEKLSRKIEGFPKEVEEFEKEMDDYISDNRNIHREICEILFSKINNYISQMLEKITGEGDLLVSYIEGKELPKDYSEKFIRFIKEAMCSYYKAYECYLEKNYEECIKILWGLYKETKKEFLNMIRLLRKIWENFNIKEKGHGREKYVI